LQLQCKEEVLLKLVAAKGVIVNYYPRKIGWTWNLWKTGAKKTNNHSQIMAIVLVKSDSAGFFVQISSQNHGAAFSHQADASQ